MSNISKSEVKSFCKDPEISEYINRIFNVLKKELGVNDKIIVSAFKDSIKNKENYVEKISKTDTKIKEPVDKACSYVFQRGDRKNERCNVPVKEGKVYCSRHCNKTNDDKKKDKIVNKKVETSKIVSKLMKNVKDNDIIEITKNKYGNYELKNNLVYDVDNKEIYGFQLEDGKVRDLNKMEIVWCKEKNLKFKFPFNLNLEEKNKIETNLDIDEDDDDLEIYEDHSEEEYDDEDNDF
jgi:hypothetical protein